MRVLLDTSVLVAALVENHPDFERASAWLRKSASGQAEVCISSHSLAEVYSVLTRTPFRPPISPAAAWDAVTRAVLAHTTVVPLSPDDYKEVLDRNARLGIIGGATYDALIVHAARKADVEHLVTLNVKHFRRLAEDDADWVLPA